MSETALLTGNSRTMVVGAKPCWITSSTAKQLNDKVESSLQRRRRRTLPPALWIFCPSLVVAIIIRRDAADRSKCEPDQRGFETAGIPYPAVGSGIEPNLDRA